MLTPLRSFLPWAGKMLTYLEAMRKPKKHTVKTLAMGKTAIFIESTKDSPPTPPSVTVNRILSTPIFPNCYQAHETTPFSMLDAISYQWNQKTPRFNSKQEFDFFIFIFGKDDKESFLRVNDYPLQISKSIEDQS